jgi:phage terminase large subunit-like protein
MLASDTELKAREVLLNAARKELARRRENAKAQRKIDSYYPDEGPYRRELYAKHLAFFAAGKEHKERAAIAANRVGKTEGVLGYEGALHLTGQYPDWWDGRRWDRPINALFGGDTGTTTRDILVNKMLGPPNARGTGLIPGKTLGKIRPAQGIPDHVDFCLVRHVSGGFSILQFRSYDQGREAWQGTERDLIGLDEEPPMDVYVEALTRTLTTGGMLMATFTPLNGMTDVVLQFMPHLAPGSA